MRLFVFIILVSVLGITTGCKSKKPKEEKNTEVNPSKATPIAIAPVTNEVPVTAPPVKNLNRNAVARTGTGSKLRQVYDALELYANDNNGKYPPPFTKNAQGSPLLSWRVLILPNLEQGNLFNKFNQNEAWDSPTNKELLKLMPKLYLTSGNYDVNVAFKTTFLVPVANETVFPPSGGVTKNSITDGFSQTILIVDADDDMAVEWSRPVDLNVNSRNPSLGLTNSNPAGFMAMFADGSSKVVPNRSIANVWAMFTRSGGEAVSP